MLDAPRTQATLNKMGWSSEVPNEYSEAFIAYAAGCTSPVLDIGAAFGTASIAALEAGATVVANDVEPRHLEVLKSKVPPEHLQRLKVVVGKFPCDLSFPDDCFGAIHASMVLHFLTGEELVDGVQRMFRWMQPGGKLFILTGTPFQGNIKAFIPVYLERKRNGVRWAGEIENVREFNNHFSADLMPSFIHCLDEDVLVPVIEQAGFIIEEVKRYSRANLPDFCKLDGRENLGLIARKNDCD